MAFLTRLFARREFPLPRFDLAPLAFELLPQSMQADADPRFLPGDSPSDVVALPSAARTPGQLRESIERHLRETRDGSPPLLEQDAVDELRQALADLRRSLA